jgi:hypothetical protein
MMLAEGCLQSQSATLICCPQFKEGRRSLGRPKTDCDFNSERDTCKASRTPALPLSPLRRCRSGGDLHEDRDDPRRARRARRRLAEFWCSFWNVGRVDGGCSGIGLRAGIVTSQLGIPRTGVSVCLASSSALRLGMKADLGTRRCWGRRHQLANRGHQGID